MTIAKTPGGRPRQRPDGRGGERRVVPAGLPVGRRDRPLPDRGRDGGGRAQAVDLGHVLPGPGRPSGTATPATSPRDHYHRWREDVGADARAGAGRVPVLRRLAAGAARGLAGRRTRPGWTSTGRLVDGLLDAGIVPVVTLYHWDLPQPLEDAGGWPRRDTAERFAEYAAIVYGALGDRAPHWMTLNEPWCSAFLGYAERRARARRPGPTPRRSRPRTTCCSAHGMAVEAMRALGGDAAFGSALNLFPVEPATDDAGGRRRRAPVGRRAEPAVPRPDAARALPGGRAARPGGASRTSRTSGTATWRVISAPIDFLGVNYYRGYMVGAATADAAGGRAGRRPAGALARRRAHRGRRAAVSDHRHGLGGRSRRAAADCWCGCTATTRGRR